MTASIPLFIYKFYLLVNLFVFPNLSYAQKQSSIIIGNEIEDFYSFSNASYSYSNTKSYFLNPKDLSLQIASMGNFLSKHLEASIADGFTHTFQNTGVNTSSLGFPDLSAFREVFSSIGDNIRTESFCSGCQVFFGLINNKIRVLGASESSVLKMIIFACEFFRISTPEVCEGIITRFGPTVYYIIKNKPKLTSFTMCGLTLQSLGCRIPRSLLIGSEYDWTVESTKKMGSSNNALTNPTPDSKAVVKIPSYIPENRHNYATKSGTRDAKIMKIVQIADLHVDYDYEVGFNANCDNKILCCQRRNGLPKEGQTAAGFYGNYPLCDTPLGVLYSVLEDIKATHGNDIDMIYMTGDLVPHNLWYTTRESNTETIQNVSSIIYQYFPNTTIIPCLGNHEAQPVDFYSPTSKSFGSSQANPIPEGLRSDWVYEVAYESWKQWIPADQEDTFLTSGNYAVEINAQFRVIVVNTNVCYCFNVWQLYAPQDPGNQLQWLQQQLELTKVLNKTAHIVGHVPPGHIDCFRTWSREFYKIVAKYRQVIRGQFYGHTHYDEFRILHDPVFKNEPINMEWICPSLTTYGVYNPGYRIYHMASGGNYTYGDIIDHETWVYNLNEVNEEYRNNASVPIGQSNHIKWFKLYQAVEAYQIDDLLPVNMRKLVDRMAKNQTTFDLFHRHYFKIIDPVHEAKEPCDNICRKKILCGIVRSYYDDDSGHELCVHLQREVDGIVLPISVMDNPNVNNSNSF